MSGNTGIWKYIDGKLVKVSDEIPSLLPILPWKEANNGYYDEELGTHVDSKQHYRALMKAQGLVPYEKNTYGKSQAQRKKEIIENSAKKNKSKLKKVFNDTLAKVK